MKQLLSILCLCVLFFPACNDDDNDQTTPRSEPAPYDTDEDVDAPVVSCAEALDLFTYDTRPAPTSERVVGLSFNGAGVGLAVDRDRVLWRVTDDGESWETLPTDLGNDFLFLPFFASEETIYLVRSVNNGEANILLRSDDRGDTFRELPIAGARTVINLYFDDPNNGMAVINAAGLSEESDYQLIGTTDGGVTWAEQTLPVASGYANFLSVDGQLALNTSSELVIRNSTTSTWEVRPYPVDVYVQEAVFADGEQGLFAGGDGKVYRTADAGRNWTTDGLRYGRPEYLHLKPDGTALMLINRYTVIGGDGLVFRGLLVYESSDAGATWSVKKTNNDCNFGFFTFITESGRLLSVGREEMVFLDR